MRQGRRSPKRSSAASRGCSERTVRPSKAPPEVGWGVGAETPLSEGLRSQHHGELRRSGRPGSLGGCGREGGRQAGKGKQTPGTGGCPVAPAAPPRSRGVQLSVGLVSRGPPWAHQDGRGDPRGLLPVLERGFPHPPLGSSPRAPPERSAQEAILALSLSSRCITRPSGNDVPTSSDGRFHTPVARQDLKET